MRRHSGLISGDLLVSCKDLFVLLKGNLLNPENFWYALIRFSGFSMKTTLGHMWGDLLVL